MRCWKWFVPLAALLLVLIAACCFPFLRRVYLLHGLRTAPEQDRPSWAAAFARLGPSAIESLLDGLEDSARAEPYAAALQAMVEQQTVSPACLAQEMGRSAALKTAQSRAYCAQLVSQWLQTHPEDEPLHAAAVILLTQWSQCPDEQLAALLSLTLSIVSRRCDPETLALARSLAQRGLQAESAMVRLRAVMLCMQPAVQLLPPLLALLRDPAPEVRRAVVLALGPVPEAISDEMLLSCLHDADAQVRQTTRSALIARGLPPEQVELGRLLTHAQVRVRLQVLDRLPEVPEVDPHVWLRRLSDDRSAAVRAAAARAWASLPESSSDDRLEEMARSDPSPTVARIARYYLSQRNRLRPASAP